MRLAFMGTPDFALVALQAIVAAGHEVAAVYSQPPRPAGRGKKPRPSPVQAWAEEQGIEVRTPLNFKEATDRDAFAALELDIAVVAAYGLILPTAILDAPKHGCINIHASLLPRWRGAAPIHRSILAGDGESGVTIMQMEKGLDTGPMLKKDALAITSQTTGGSLHDALAIMGGRLVLESLAEIAAGAAVPVVQPAEGVTYAAKLEKAEAIIDFTRPAEEIDRLIRAFNPYPGASLEHGKDRIRILSAEIIDADGAPGEVLDEALTIACGTGALRPVTVQRAGKAPMATEAFLRGFDKLPKGSVVGESA